MDLCGEFGVDGLPVRFGDRRDHLLHQLAPLGVVAVVHDVILLREDFASSREHYYSVARSIIFGFLVLQLNVEAEV